MGCDPLPIVSALGRIGSPWVELGRNRGVGEGVLESPGSPSSPASPASEQQALRPTKLKPRRKKQAGIQARKCQVSPKYGGNRLRYTGIAGMTDIARNRRHRRNRRNRAESP